MYCRFTRSAATSASAALTSASAALAACSSDDRARLEIVGVRRRRDAALRELALALGLLPRLGHVRARGGDARLRRRRAHARRFDRGFAVGVLELEQQVAGLHPLRLRARARCATLPGDLRADARHHLRLDVAGRRQFDRGLRRRDTLISVTATSVLKTSA